MPRLSLSLLVLASVSAMLLVGCAYRGGSDPFSRKVSWFSYLEGADIRAKCHDHADERYRFVYNGIYKEQIRAYDLTTGLGADRHHLRARVIGAADLTLLRLDDPLAPWRGLESEIRLRDQDLATLRKAMAAGGVFEGPPVGLELHSDDFYWTVAACSGGRFHFTAYRWPSERFDKAAFPKLLLGWDASGVPLNAPRETTMFELWGTNHPEHVARFNLKVGGDGLVGVTAF